MLQLMFLIYSSLMIVLFGLLYSLNDLSKFFVFSELTWLLIFLFCLILSSYTNSTALYTQTLFILVFTACEAVILSTILLLSFETSFFTKLVNNNF